MGTEIKDFEVYVGHGITAFFSVENDCFLTINFRDRTGVAQMPIQSPELIVKALSEFKKKHVCFKPTCLLYQGPDFAVYYFEIIL